MIRVTRNISIDEAGLHVSFVRSDGPGGQNVNKVATAVQLRFDAAGCPALSDEVRQRLLRLAGRRANAAGQIVIDARRYRSQARNRDDAVDRLVRLIRRAAQPPKPRRKTQPTGTSKRKRLESKRRRSATKGLRRGPTKDDW